MDFSRISSPLFLQGVVLATTKKIFKTHFSTFAKQQHIFVCTRKKNVEEEVQLLNGIMRDVKNVTLISPFVL